MDATRRWLVEWWQPWRAPGLVRRVVLAWALMQGVLLGNAALTGKWPWSMFSAGIGPYRTLVVEARVDGGPWEALPVEDVFRYTRGFTALRVPNEAKALKGDRRHAERERFARWMVEQTAPDAGYDEVRLWWSSTSKRGKPREHHLGQWRLR